MARRREAESQVDAAARFDVSLYRYRQWETDEEKSPHELGLGKLSGFEACFLMRKRAGTTMAAVAKKVGVSRWWLCQMERGEVDSARLVSFWQEA